MKVLKYIWIPVLIYFAWFTFLRSPEAKMGKMAPDFSSELIDGTPFQLSDLKGKYVLLDFWGSWCAPCRRDSPNLVKLHNEFNDATFNNAQGFEIVSVALEKDNRRWKKASIKDGFIWKYQIVSQSKIVLLSPIAKKYNVSNIPAKFLIDPQGEIIGINQSLLEIKALLSLKTT